MKIIKRPPLTTEWVGRMARADIAINAVPQFKKWVYSVNGHQVSREAYQALHKAALSMTTPKSDRKVYPGGVVCLKQTVTIGVPAYVAKAAGTLKFMEEYQ